MLGASKDQVEDEPSSTQSPDPDELRAMAAHIVTMKPQPS